MDILAVLGILVAVILILIGLYMIFLSKTDSPPKSSVIDQSVHHAPPTILHTEPQVESQDESQVESQVLSVPLIDSAPISLPAVPSANEFITQTIKQHSHLHARIHSGVDQPTADDQKAENLALLDPLSADLQLPLFMDSATEAVVSEFDGADEQNHNRLDKMLDDLAQATSLSNTSYRNDIVADLNHAYDSPMTHADIPTTAFKTVVDTSQLTVWEGESALINEHLAEHIRSEENSILVQAEQIIAIHLIPKNSRPLEGRTVLRLLRKYGLRFGEMDLFHRFEETTGEGAMMFSVLKYTSEGPAGFDLDTMEQEDFDGLSFFLALPGIMPLQGFDMMMSTAQRLGQECYAQLLDDEMNLLSEQLKGHYRHQVLDFRPAR